MNQISDNLLFRRSLLPLLDSALDAAALRQKTIANNVANAEDRWLQSSGSGV